MIGNATRELPDGARQQATKLCIPFEQRTQRFMQVGCAGFARYSKIECRQKAE